MRRWGVAAAFVTLVLAAPAHAQVPVQTITVVNRVGVSAAKLAKVERAVVIQSRQLRDWWHTPVVSFGPNGWPLYLESKRSEPPGVYGYHGMRNGTPFLRVVGQDLPGARSGLLCGSSERASDSAPCRPMYSPWSTAFSHEILETLQNPTAGDALPEVCDPVSTLSYQLRGVWVSDFATPHWFTWGSSGPWDQMRYIARAGG